MDRKFKGSNAMASIESNYRTKCAAPTDTITTMHKNCECVAATNTTTKTHSSMATKHTLVSKYKQNSFFRFIHLMMYVVYIMNHIHH